ncbi:hypothetical protein N0754_18905 [Pseudomonas aeruginosa]|nr:hypothetical protein [Pseudomonas aeruginosa]MCS9764307.1 hypothetical protein [Pseudomonas aeruginosa]MCS9820483.1 hypothetical protein [Pseudomonas aeruginosa]MCT0241064.1 hypothetical protein [Pseudomonas aeruginosa]MCT0528517.1 hypothetical protein [Pseudomonas aeruginosa]
MRTLVLSMLLSTVTFTVIALFGRIATGHLLSPEVAVGIGALNGVVVSLIVHQHLRRKSKAQGV